MPPPFHLPIRPSSSAYNIILSTTLKPTTTPPISYPQRRAASQTTMPDDPQSTTPTTPTAKSILSTPLALFSLSPVTGYHRDGYCRASPSDAGNHSVAGIVSESVPRLHGRARERPARRARAEGRLQVVSLRGPVEGGLGGVPTGGGWEGGRAEVSLSGLICKGWECWWLLGWGSCGREGSWSVGGAQTGGYKHADASFSPQDSVKRYARRGIAGPAHRGLEGVCERQAVLTSTFWEQALCGNIMMGESVVEWHCTEYGMA